MTPLCIRRLLLLACALLAPIVAYAAVSANLSVQVVPVTAPGAIACDVGTPYIGAIPPAAQASGFTHCAANYDFTQTGAFTTNSHTYQWSSLSSWLEQCGASSPIVFAKTYGPPPTGCNDFQMVDDGGSQVLKMIYTQADYNTGQGLTWIATDSQIGDPNPAGVWMYQGFYIDESMRLDADTFNGSPSSCSPQAQGACYTFDFWSSTVQGACPTCSGQYEFDFLEIFSTDPNQAGYGGGGAAAAGGVGFPADFTNYHSYGGLLTLTTANSGNNYAACWTYDEQSRGCADKNIADVDKGQQKYDIFIAELGPQCDPGVGCEPSRSQYAYIKRMTIWACAGYRSGPCYTGSLVNY